MFREPVVRETEGLRYNPGEEYDHFSPAFYWTWGDYPNVMEQAREINDLYNTYLYAFDAGYPALLDTQIQDYLNENNKITINLGD